jgi:vitellogenic carboxypeptidase-like protein
MATVRRSVSMAAAALCLAASASAAGAAGDALGRRQLSPLLRAGEDVLAPSKVGPLPGINASSYSGFFEVNATAHASLFFWYWPALSGNASAPLLVWLQGGPGSSSLFGMLVELGPFRVTTPDLQPAYNPDSWAGEYSVVFVDNPRGTGYSFTDNGTLCTDWQCYGEDFDSFLRQFVQAYGLQANDVYITGESYGGHYVPASAFTVHEGNAAGRQPFVNLRGIAVGNGFVAPAEMSAGYADAIYNAGLISWDDYAVAQSYVANISARLAADDTVGAYRVWDAFLNGDTTPGGAWFTNVTGLTNYFNIANDPGMAFSYFETWVTSAAVRAAIGVGSQPYADGNVAVEIALEADVMYSQRPRVEALLQSAAPRYKVLIYNGALDIICGAPLTERYIALLDWPGSTAFAATRRAVWLDPQFTDGTVSGYVRAAASAQAGLLVQAVVRGGGHMVPFDQPSRALDLITRFVGGSFGGEDE